MKKTLIAFALGLACLISASAQGVVTVREGRFQKGDDPAWSQASFNDRGWQVLSLEKDWNQQGIRNANGYGPAATCRIWTF